MPEKIGYQESVLEVIKRVPKGRVTTYGLIAKALGSSPRAVGQALHMNKQLVVIPCHRVVMSDGSLGGYVNGVSEKKRLLESEGVDVSRLLDYLWTPLMFNACVFLAV